jgi:CheY-like chemotaxis protein
MNGHFVLEESNGQDAIATIEREHPDIALIDIGLPLLNGYEVARALRRNRALDDVLLVALTGYGMQHDIVEARSAGFDDHLTKPTDLERLEELIEKRGTRSKAS